MKKGIVISLAITLMVLFVGCGDKNISEAIKGSWYQTQTTETKIESDYITDDYYGVKYVYDGITLTITSTVTYQFNQDTFSCTQEVIQEKSGIAEVYTSGEPYIDEFGDTQYSYTYEDIKVSETTTDTEQTLGSWYIEDGKLFMIQNDAQTGTSYNAYIFGDELILESENAATFLKFKKK